MAKPAAEFKHLVILGSMLAPVLGGAIIYYSLKSKYLSLAKLGNNLSFVAAVLWFAVWWGLTRLNLPFSPLLVYGGEIAGIALSVWAVINIKKTEPTTNNTKG